MFLLSLLLACREPITPANPVYYGAVEKDLESCATTCHTSESHLPLNTYETASSYADRIYSAVESGRMPPWLPASEAAIDYDENPLGYQNDFSLSESQKENILEWVQTGAQEGNPEDGIETSSTNQTLETDFPALEIGEYTLYPPEYTGTESDYRCFLMDWPGTEEEPFVRGFQVVPDLKDAVHHAILYRVPEDYDGYDLDSYNYSDGENGWPCYGGINQSENIDDDPLAYMGASLVGVSALGSLPFYFPNNSGIRMAEGDRMIMQIHYDKAKIAAPVVDNTQVLFDVSDSVEHEGSIVFLLDLRWIYNLEVDPHSTVTLETSEFDFDWAATYVTGWPFPKDSKVTIAAVAGHAHGNTTEISLGAIKETTQNEAVLLDIPEWDMDFQMGYVFKNPMTISTADNIHINCVIENNTDETITWGEGSDDAMCVGIFYGYLAEE